MKEQLPQVKSIKSYPDLSPLRSTGLKSLTGEVATAFSRTEDLFWIRYEFNTRAHTHPPARAPLHSCERGPDKNPEPRI